MMDMTEVIFDDDWHQILDVDRRAGNYDAGGVWNETYTRVNVDAALHPASQDAMQLLAEGERELPGLKVYSVQEIGFGDLVYWRGETWRVFAVQEYADYGFYDCSAVRHLGTTAPSGAAFELS
jgi:hypothetical protein